jgi:signal transduction histidine kinase
LIATSRPSQLERLIDGLLTLMRGQAGVERREHVDLAALTSQAIVARESQLASFDLDVRATLATAPTAGDPRLLERLIGNLVDNTIRHNTPGGHVAITTGTRDRHAFVSVGNTSPTSAGARPHGGLIIEVSFPLVVGAGSEATFTTARAEPGSPRAGLRA